MENINTQRIGGGTFFKLLLVGAVFTHILFVLIVMFGMLLGIFTPTEADMPMPVWTSELFLLGYLVFWLDSYTALDRNFLARSLSWHLAILKI